MIELGGNIRLEGFRELDQPTLIIVKKIVGNYAKKIVEETKPFDRLHLSLKLNKDPKNKYGLNAKLSTNKNTINSDVAESNLFFALDRALNKIFFEAKK